MSELNLLAGIRGSPKKVVLKMLKEDSEEVSLLLLISGLDPPALHIFLDLQLELGYANKHRFQILDGPCMQHLHVCPYAFKLDILAVMDVSNKTPPSIYALESVGTFEYRLGLA